MPWFKCIHPTILGFQILILCFAGIWLVYMHKTDPVTKRSHLPKPLLKIMLQVSRYSVVACPTVYVSVILSFKGMCVFELV
jgi:hypothetical protein